MTCRVCSVMQPIWLKLVVLRFMHMTRSTSNFNSYDLSMEQNPDHKVGPIEKYCDTGKLSEFRPKLAQIVGLCVSTHRFD